MQNFKRNIILFFSVIIGFGVFYAGFSFVFLDFMVDLWWFDSLGYEAYFLMRLSYRYMLFAATTLIFFLIFFLNFWIASRYLGMPDNSQPQEPGDAPQYQSEEKRQRNRLLAMFQSGSLRVYTLLSLILAIPIAIPLYEKWEEALLYIFSGHSGITEPTFGKDISFYMFSLPIYKLIQNELFITFSLLSLFLLILYWIQSRLLSKKDLRLPDGARAHLSIMFLIVAMIQGWNCMLQRYELLYSENHLPLFYGPGFVEMNVVLPLIWLTFVSLIAGAIFLVTYIQNRKGLKPLIISILLLISCVTVWKTSFLAENIEKYFVKPNQAEREKPYIGRTIQDTLKAYNLSITETRNYPVNQTPNMTITQEMKNTIRNIPIWDRHLIDDVYNQLQKMRSFYHFADADVDRYTIGGVKQQVYLSAREINTEGLAPGAKNWINTHLLYTHGYGIVMTPAAQRGDEPMKWLVQDIPMRSDAGFTIKNPAIYYGSNTNEYAIVPNESGEIDHFENDKDVKNNYNGKGGVALSSFRKLLFAVYLKKSDLFFTTETKRDSRVLINRNVSEAISKITPYFTVDRDPYIVATSAGLFWVADAYTTSGLYPCAEKADKKINYIRNSVKVVIDAYNGTTDYYIADNRDPIVNAYRRMYPGLLKPIDQMNPEIRNHHLRYPKSLFETQMAIYAKYHQSDADSFYLQEDNWEFTQSGDMKSYYMTLNAFETDRTDRFVLLCPMMTAVSGKGKNLENLRALAVMGSDEGNYGKLSILTFPKGQQVYTPSQINSIIDQDTTISQELNLWGQPGADVKRGRIIVLPVGGTVFYIQPLYLRSSAGPKIPELKRIIFTQGDIVIMEKSLEEAIARLEAKIAERTGKVRPQ